MANTNIKEFFIEVPAQEANIAKQRQKSEITYSIAVESGIDIVIKRAKTTATGKESDVKYLALLFSQKQYYIKTERNGEIKPLKNGVELVGFLSGITIDTPITFNHCVVDVLDKRKDWCEDAVRALHDKKFIELAKLGLVTLNSWVSAGSEKEYKYYAAKSSDTLSPLEIILENATLINRMLDIHSANTGVDKVLLVKYFWTKIRRGYIRDYHAYTYNAKLLTWDTIQSFILLSNIYGQDIAKNMFATWSENDFIQSFSPADLMRVFNVIRRADYAREKALTMVGSNGKTKKITSDVAERRLMKNVEPQLTFDWKSFKTYFFHYSQSNGFADSMQEFCMNWADTLSMQILVYGKIVDKYPEELDKMHRILSWKTRILQNKIDEEAFEKATIKAKSFEGEYKAPSGAEWLLKAPTCREDIIDEATQMSNCVASYVNKMAEGRCTIMFLRRADAPEKSVCTVEISPMDCVVQFKAKHNANPGTDARNALYAICEANGIELASHI